VSAPAHIEVKPFFWLAVGLLAWWLFPTAHRAFLKDAFHEFQAPLVLAQSHLDDLRTYWAIRAGNTKENLIRFNRDLNRHSAFLETEISRLQWLARENHRLEELLDLVPPAAHRVVIARVARRDLNAWWSRVLLRRGSLDGVRDGNPVIIGGSVVGRVVKTHRNTCEVQLLSDPAFRISVNVEGDERAAVYQGVPNKPFDPPRGLLTFLPADYTTPASGDTVGVFTSGAGGVFPGGLNVGRVTGGLTQTPDGLFLSGDVLLHPLLSSIKEVSILVPLKPDSALGEQALPP
jgi:rod shape-determining protein MreC